MILQKHTSSYNATSRSNPSQITTLIKKDSNITKTKKSAINHIDGNRRPSCSSHAAITRKHLTPPTAIATFPLLAPETTTGVYRSVVVPSPTCAERYHHQPNTHIPHDTQRPLENKQQESPGHKRSLPSRKLNRHSTVHKSEAAHIASVSHYPNPSKITTVAAHDRNIAK